MKTAVLRIDEPAVGQTDFPLQLFVDDGSATWSTTPIESATMDANLAEAKLPLNDAGGQMGWRDIVPYMLSGANPSTTLQRIGQHLLGQLTPDPIGEKWRALAAKQAAVGEGLRTVLDVRPTALRRLPWELIASGDQRPFIDASYPWFRKAAQVSPVPPTELGPLRILIVVGSRRTDILAEEEVAQIQKAVRQVGVTFVLREPDRGTLDQTYSAWRPHVVHFICHGAQIAGTGAVLLIGDQPHWEFRRQDIVNWQRGAVGASGWTGRLAILNACRSNNGTPAPALHEATSSLADAFLERGFAAVVGMQGDIDAKAAATFSAPFYAAIADGHPIDVAVSSARYAIGPAMDLDRRDWALPSLTIGCDPDNVLAVERPQPVIQVDAITEFDTIRDFIDRGTERMGLWRRLDPEGFGLEPKGLTLVVGEESMGKTWLIWKVLWICAFRARTVRYVNLGGKNALDWLGVLRRITEGSAPSGLVSSPLQGPLPVAHFERFNHTVKYLATGKPLRPFTPGGVTAKDLPATYKGTDENGVEVIFNAFVAGLQTLAGSGPVLIALDHVSPDRNVGGGIDKGTLGTLAMFLLRKAQLGEIPDVRLIVALTDAERESHWPPDFDIRDLVVTVPGIPVQDFVPLAKELCVHRGFPSNAFVLAAQGLQDNLPGPWKPSVLAGIVRDVLGPAND